jgi:Protein of unknown function (DUF3108)
MRAAILLGACLALFSCGAAAQEFAVQTSTITCESSAWRVTGGAPLPKSEELNFVLRWGIVTAGRATLTIRSTETVAGRFAYHISSFARSTGLVDTFYTVQDHSDAWLDVQSLTTLRYEKNVREGSYRIQENADFDQPCRRFVQHSYRFDKKRSEEREGRLPPNAMDVFGSLYYLRTVPLAAGQTYTLDVLSGDKLWPMTVLVAKRETIKVSAGTFDCFRLEPHLRAPGIFVTKGKKVEVWITADERRMPVRMRSEVVIGHVAAELTSYK